MKIASGKVFNSPPPGVAIMRASPKRDVSIGPDRTVSYVFSDTSVGRDFHTIAADAWKLDNFKKNPVALWCHTPSEPPIGRVLNLRTVGSELRGDIQYADADTYPFADVLFRLVKGAFLNATSVSWLPLEWKSTNDRKRPGGVDFSSVELLEISNVSVPALPSALVTARSAGIDVAPVIKWAERALDAPKAFAPRKELEMIRSLAGAPKVYGAPKRPDVPPAADDSLPISRAERERRARRYRREFGVDSPFESFGEFLRSVAVADSAGATPDERLTRAPHGLSEQDPTAGGFAVPTAYVDELVGSIYEEARIAPLCDILETSLAVETRFPTFEETSRANGQRWGGITAYWAAEAASVTPSLPTFRAAVLEPKKLIGVCVATEELIRDVPLLEAYIRRAFASEFSFMLDAAIFAGTGAGVPLGVLNAGALITVAKDTGQAPATISATNIDMMWSRLAFPCRRRAVWLVNEDVDRQLATLGLVQGTSGALASTAAALYVPQGAAGENPYSLLKGRPVLEIEQAPALGTPGDIMLVDMSQYAILDTGMKGALSLEVNFLSFQGVFRFTLRVDGQPLWSSPVTAYNGTSTRSPFVALAAR